jgi:hypothetical protein
MFRTGVFILMLTLGDALPANSGSGTAPVMLLSIYAPIQTDSPVRIVGFEHGQEEIRFVLSNTSDVAVESVIIDRVTMAPEGCAATPKGRTADGGGRSRIAILPHGEAVLSFPQVLYPGLLIHTSREWRAAYMQTQFWVGGVFFKDGTTWPGTIDSHIAAEPLDPRLVEAQISKCINVAAVASAIQPGQEIVFEKEGPESSNTETASPPELDFSCTLKGAKALCHMPLEKGSRLTQVPTSGASHN